MKLRACTLWIFLFLLYNCNSNQNDVHRESNLPDSVVSIVYQKCSTDTSQSYWIALPDERDILEKQPLIIAFDPHGDGKLAVSTLMGAVTDLGYIVAGSNVIRNGYERIDNAFATLMDDIQKRYKTGKEGIYAVGFSGGGRFAQIFSQMYPDTKAVISIGAGPVFNPSAQPVNKLPLLFLAGNEDFNYLEINNSMDNLKSMGFHCFFYEYNGKHEWPPRQIMNEALLWFEFDDCRRNKNMKNDHLIKDYQEIMNRRAGQLIADNDPMQACQEYEKGIAFLSGLVSTKSMLRKIENCMKSDIYKDQLDKKEYAHNLEVRLQQGYIQALNQKDTIWWGNEIRNLDREIREEKDPYKLQALNRIKSFISIASYSYCNASLKDNDLEKAARLIKIYRTIDPANPDVNYFSALYYSKLGQPVRAEEYFRKAVRSGFKDLKKASNELPPEIYNAGLSPE